MSTDTLWLAIWNYLHQSSPPRARDASQQSIDLARIIRENVLAPLVREAQAEAWDSCAATAYAALGVSSSTMVNPYRATQRQVTTEREANRAAGRLSWQREGCVCKVQDSPDPACRVCSGGAS